MLCHVMLPRSVEKQGLTQLVSVRPSVPKVPRSIGFTSNPSLDLLGTYPGCQRCESRSGEKMIVNQQFSTSVFTLSPLVSEKTSGIQGSV